MKLASGFGVEIFGLKVQGKLRILNAKLQEPRAQRKRQLCAPAGSRRAAFSLLLLIFLGLSRYQQ